jgi:hypothetical protein
MEDQGMRRRYEVDRAMCEPDSSEDDFVLADFCTTLQGYCDGGSVPVDVQVVPIGDTYDGARNPDSSIVSEEAFRDALEAYAAIRGVE